MKVSTVEQMRECDRRAIAEYGIPEEILMENAGAAAYSVIRDTCGIENRQFTVLAGTGNNGGDGFVVARMLSSRGGSVLVFLLGSPENIKGAALQNYSILEKMGVTIIRLDDTVERLITAIKASDAVVDALFGTGLSRSVEGIYAEAINAVNRASRLVFSLDIPSGVNGNTGQVMGTAVRADFTITFGLPKIGNICYPGWERGGKLAVTNISFPPAVYEAPEIKTEINVPLPLPDRPEAGHKSSFGTALFIAGASMYLGAPFFAAFSFLKCGGGYARLATTNEVIPVVAGKAGEVVFHPMQSTETGSIAYNNSDVLKMLAAQTMVVVLGPGISLNNETQKLVLELVPDISKPLIVDGDGLTAVARNPLVFQKREKPTVLTPHPGEMSRLAGLSVKEIEANRTRIAAEQAEKLNSIIVLKGAHTVIACPGGKTFINVSGNSGMGTAGSGDVLSGVIASLIAFGVGLGSGIDTGGDGAAAVSNFTLEEAVKTAVFLHGYAGDLAAAKHGEDGITAENILNFLPKAVKTFRDGYWEIVGSSYHTISQL